MQPVLYPGYTIFFLNIVKDLKNLLILSLNKYHVLRVVCLQLIMLLLTSIIPTRVSEHRPHSTRCLTWKTLAVVS